MSWGIVGFLFTVGMGLPIGAEPNRRSCKAVYTLCRCAAAPSHTHSKNNLTALARLGSVHNSSTSKILSAKAWLQGEKHSKVEHLASIFNAAGAF
ncbi:hypothetical protein, partial [Uruburuella suis]|uniref:hypothetical protein n=1 Tax=Uruburuella suis TaxID=252130 RepID=UPI001A9E1AF8